MSGQDPAPEVSVVIACCSGPDDLRLCLESLVPQAGAAEVIVAAPGTSGSREVVARFPQVRLVEATGTSSVFRLRSLGLERARGRHVALTEDHCVPEPHWLAGLLAALADGHRAVGGPVDSGRDGIRARALFLVEYGALLPGPPAGKSTILSGANAAYDAQALDRCRSTWQDVFCENEVHDALLGAGHALYRVEEARVKTRLRMSLREALRHLFRGGRRFGGYRRARSSAAFRLLFPFAAPALPCLLLWRIFRLVLSRRRGWLPAFVLGLPEMTALVLAWSAGELSGHLWPVGASAAVAGS